MMHETEYAYAVARVRANELTLLSATDVEQLISAEDYKQVMRRLADTGWGDSENVTDYSHYL
ncbi:MAG: V-type ATPase subunit, partial [Oscillospiraceae bacterium]